MATAISRHKSSVTCTTSAETPLQVPAQRVEFRKLCKCGPQPHEGHRAVRWPRPPAARRQGTSTKYSHSDCDSPPEAAGSCCETSNNRRSLTSRLLASASHFTPGQLETHPGNKPFQRELSGLWKGSHRLPGKLPGHSVRGRPAAHESQTGAAPAPPSGSPPIQTVPRRCRHGAGWLRSSWSGQLPSQLKLIAEPTTQLISVSLVRLLVRRDQSR